MIRHLLPFSLLVFALSAKAQPAVVVSPVASFDYGSPLFINRTQGVLNPLPGNLSGSSSGASYGLGGQITLPIVGSLGLMGRMEAVYSTGSFASSAISIFGNDFKLLMEAAAEWESSQFAVSVGPWISQRFAGGHVLEQDSNGTNITPSNAMSSATHLGLFAGLICNIHNFPLRPELNTHLDLGELSEAGANAWSVGISLAYHFGGVSHALALPKVGQAKAWPTPPEPPRVQFFVNGSPAHGNPPLERVETHIEDYAMVDSANAPPRVSQWIEESYHLPHLAIACEFSPKDKSALTISNDNRRLIEKSFSITARGARRVDTTIDLDADFVWQKVLGHLNAGASNRLVVELQTDSQSARDTLLLPPADSTRSTLTNVKHEFRFELSDNYSQYLGGTQSLDLLLARMKELLDSTNTIRIQEGASEQNLPRHAALEKRLARVLGNREIERTTSANVHDGMVVVLER